MDSLELKLDLIKLKLLKLTPNQYCYLYCKIKNIAIFKLEDLEIEALDYYGYIHIVDDDIDNVILRPKALALFAVASTDEKFLEFWTSYPIHVPNGKGGHRILRTKDHDSKQAKDCKKKYINIINKNPELHEKILKGLQYYVKNEHPYIVGVEVFLNGKYEQYLDLENENKINIGSTEAA